MRHFNCRITDFISTSYWPGSHKRDCHVVAAFNKLFCALLKKRAQIVEPIRYKKMNKGEFNFSFIAGRDISDGELRLNSNRVPTNPQPNI